MASSQNMSVPTSLMQINHGEQTMQEMRMHEELGKLAQEDVEETVSDEVFSNYKHKDILPGCQPHPGDIVEAGTLSVSSHGII